MHLLVVGLHYKTAPVEIREKLIFDESQTGEATRQLKSRKNVLEAVIISTCNRTEVYAVVDQLYTGKTDIKEFLADWFSLERALFEDFLFFYENEKAVEHLFKVTSGLDSLVLGETQILGQVRRSFLEAQVNDTTGTIFNHLFKRAITLAKKAHNETEIGANAVSVSYAAVELGKKIFGDLTGKHVLVVGAGKMAELALQNIHGSGAENMMVINRTYENAVEMANKFHGKAYSMERLIDCLLMADIVITSTGARNFIITKEMLATVDQVRKGKPIILIDIALPRNIEQTIDEFSSVFLYDLDDLEGIVEGNLQERTKTAEMIMEWIEDETIEFQTWLLTLEAIPLISSLREKALSIHAETMKSIERKLPDLSEREKNIINKHTKSIVNQMLRDPILQIKDLVAGENGQEAANYFQQIFNLVDLEEELPKTNSNMNTKMTSTRTEA